MLQSRWFSSLRRSKKERKTRGSAILSEASQAQNGAINLLLFLLYFVPFMFLLSDDRIDSPQALYQKHSLYYVPYSCECIYLGLNIAVYLIWFVVWGWDCYFFTWRLMLQIPHSHIVRKLWKNTRSTTYIVNPPFRYLNIVYWLIGYV